MNTILFETQLYPSSELNCYLNNSKTGLDYAAHNLCTALYKGIKDNCQNVELINAPNLGSFPTLYSRPYVKEAYMDDGVSIPFYNIAFLKRSCIRRRLKKRIVSSLKNNNECPILLLYNFRCVSFLKDLKSRWPSLKICIIITDLLEYMLRPQSKLFKIGEMFFKNDGDFIEEGFKYIDGFVLLSDYMAQKLPLHNKPYIIIEGIYNTDTVVDKTEKEGKMVLYSGNLNKRYGILTLLEAFHRTTNPEYCLKICGDGDGVQDILNYSKKDQRIQYLGLLARNEVLTLQKKATLLVNPRNSKDEYTKFSFPSKTMEYLASGTPVLMSHLLSIPPEYDNHIYYQNDETIEGWSDSIENILSKKEEELSAFGESSAEFILTQKTPQPQVKRLLDFISHI